MYESLRIKQVSADHQTKDCSTCRVLLLPPQLLSSPKIQICPIWFDYLHSSKWKLCYVTEKIPLPLVDCWWLLSAWLYSVNKKMKIRKGMNDSKTIQGQLPGQAFKTLNFFKLQQSIAEYLCTKTKVSLRGRHLHALVENSKICMFYDKELRNDTGLSNDNLCSHSLTIA